MASEVWRCRLPTSGKVIAIVRTEAEARQACPETPVFTMAEVAVAIEALGEAAIEAKRAFSGVAVIAVRNMGEESTGQPASDHKETPTMLKQKPKKAASKPKPLPPSGSYQSLSKKMPKDTRYKGESFPAGNIEARYEEHMAKQRAAALAEGGKS